MFTFELESGLGSVPVSISDDGEIVFNDSDTAEALDYDTSMVEFGENLSSLLGFFWATKKSHIAPLHQVLIFDDMVDFRPKKTSLSSMVTAWYADVPENLESLEECTSALLLLDYLEHVIPIYEERHPRSFVMRRAVDIIRKFVLAQRRALKEYRFDSWLQTTQYAELKNVVERSKKAVDDIYRKSDPLSPEMGVVIAVAAQANWIWRHAGRSGEFSRYGRIQGSAEFAARAVGHSVNVNVVSNEYVAAANTERRWQVRRFADVMSALKKNKRWPPLGATK